MQDRHASTSVYAYEEGQLPSPESLLALAIGGKMAAMETRPDLMMGFCGAGAGALYMEDADFADMEEEMLYIVAPDDDRTGLFIEAHWYDGACWQSHVDPAGKCTPWDRIS